MTATHQDRQEYYGVQALRAVAALIVVAGHSTDFLGMQNGSLPSGLRWLHGPVGVDIFFVISGFVMMITSERFLRKVNPARLFLWRRMVRIVPLYWALTLLRLVTLSIWPSLSMHESPSMWNVVASFLFIPAWSRSGEIRPVIAVGWTLSFEMMFYAVFALALTVRRRLFHVLIPSILVIALLGCFRASGWPAWTALFDPIVLEFLMGCGIAKLVMRGRRFPSAIYWLLMVAGAAGLVLFEPGNWVLGRTLEWGVPAALLVIGAAGLEPLLHRWVPTWLLLLGNASYSIYLIQTFVVAPSHMVLTHIAPGMIHQRPMLAALLLIGSGLISTSIAGVLSYLFLERPMTDFLKARLGSDKTSPTVGQERLETSGQS